MTLHLNVHHSLRTRQISSLIIFLALILWHPSPNSIHNLGLFVNASTTTLAGAANQDMQQFNGLKNYWMYTSRLGFPCPDMLRTQGR